jgi:hypothetical protein
MADGNAGVTRTDAGSLDTKSPGHEWERVWKVVHDGTSDRMLVFDGSANDLSISGEFVTIPAEASRLQLPEWPSL